jgi:3',5'-cyclic-AMP phosphodiesterase
MALSLRHVLAAAEDSRELSIALLSDTHIHFDPKHEFRHFRPFDNLARAVTEIATSNAEFALLCGDAARLVGKVEDYQALQKLIAPLSPKIKTEIALGNHDDRKNFATVFGQDRSVDALRSTKHVTIVDFGVQRWILLDSLMFVDTVPGFLGKEQREWLNHDLASNANKPVMLMVHHTLGDGDGDLLDADRLIAIASAHPHVKAIIFGHSHRWSVKQERGLWMVNLPALGYNFADDQPIGWTMAQLGPNSISLKLHAIGGNTQEDQTAKNLAW